MGVRQIGQSGCAPGARAVVAPWRQAPQRMWPQLFEGRGGILAWRGKRSTKQLMVGAKGEGQSECMDGTIQCVGVVVPREQQGV